jgi:hypothetical protein
MQTLAAVDIAMCGSVRNNRVGMPSSSQLSSDILDKLPRTSTLHFQKDSMCVIAWKDKKPICILYNHMQPTDELVTLHRHCKHGGHYDVQAPTAIADYFKYMRAVDVINQLRYTYPIGRKSKRARWRLVWWLIDMCIVNAYTIWAFDRQGANQLDFRKQLMYEMVCVHSKQIHDTAERAAAARGAILLKDHYPLNAQVAADCAYKQQHIDSRARPTYVCAACKVHLCVDPCFHLYSHKP